MCEIPRVSRRDFLGGTLAAAGVAGAVAAEGRAAEPAAPEGKPTAAAKPAAAPPAAEAGKVPCGTIGNAKISRMLLGGNLLSGNMHCRDLKYVARLFRAYVNEEKIMETFKLAEQHGVNTVFETGANFVEKYNRECGGHMQFIPHIKIEPGWGENDLKDHIRRQAESGAVALYVWGVAADNLIKAGDVGRIAQAVELAKVHNLPVGVGGHSLSVPVACEKHGVPCDFYVKTLHSDNYPSATPKELRKDFMWIDRTPGWYDNMFCIDPEETIAFMQTVTKPWLAFKVLAAGAFYPRDGFSYAFKNGADFIAVGMFDFQVKENCELVCQLVRRERNRARPWRA